LINYTTKLRSMGEEFALTDGFERENEVQSLWGEY